MTKQFKSALKNYLYVHFYYSRQIFACEQAIIKYAKSFALYQLLLYLYVCMYVCIVCAYMYVYVCFMNVYM